MQLPTDEAQLKHIAAQLRKPEGEAGTEVAKMMNIGNSPMNLHTIAVLNPQPNQHILEVGMANGFYTKHVLQMHESLKYTGLDYSAQMVSEAEALNAEYVKAGRATYVHGNIDAMPFETASFDQIFTVNTFYFWEDHKATLLELKRVLKPNSALVLSIRPKQVLEKLSFTKYGFSMIETNQILKMLSEAGFHSIELTELKEPKSSPWDDEMQREVHFIKALK